MQTYEYKVIPAPRRGEKVRGARSVPERFAHALTHAMNDMARDGWEYLRADTLPCDERVGLTGTATHFQNMLVFRRAMALPAARQPEPPRPPLVLVPDPMPDPGPGATRVVLVAQRPEQGAGPTINPSASPFTQAPPNGRA